MFAVAGVIALVVSLGIVAVESKTSFGVDDTQPKTEQTR